MESSTNTVPYKFPCDNSLNVNSLSSHTVQSIPLAILKYLYQHFVADCKVDGFWFDVAADVPRLGTLCYIHLYEHLFDGLTPLTPACLAIHHARTFIKMRHLYCSDLHLEICTNHAHQVTFCK